MNLTEALAAKLADNRSHLSDDVQAVMEQATVDLQQSGVANRALDVGNVIPAFSLPNALDKAISNGDLLAAGPLVISFYRGGWCPYCNLELRALQAALPEIQAMGATLVAISPETPDNSLSTVEKQELTFEVLSDQGNRLARQFGLVFTLPESLRPIYTAFGIDLPARNGDATFELPLPATYVVNPDGTIVHSFVDVDYTQRLAPEAIVAALKQLQ
jgi:peroxiredoxin